MDKYRNLKRADEGNVYRIWAEKSQKEEEAIEWRITDGHVVQNVRCDTADKVGGGDRRDAVGLGES